MAGTAALGFLAGKYLPKSRVFRPIVLGQQTDRAAGFTAAHDRSDLLGREGMAEMNLHPAGRAIFGDERVNVITRGEFIESGSGVRVIETHGSRIVVEKV
jgi:membrane-bound serine protease (ClpP class)